MRLRPRQVWGAGVIVAAVGLLALVALAAEQAPFDVDDDTGGIHVPSWGSVFVLGLVVLLMALWIILFVSAQRASGPVARVPRQRGLLNMVATVLVLIALLALLKALRQNHQPETQPVAPPDTEADSETLPGGVPHRQALGSADARRRRARGARRCGDDPTADGRGRRRPTSPPSGQRSSPRSRALSAPCPSRATTALRSSLRYATLLDGLARAGRPRPARTKRRRSTCDASSAGGRCVQSR